MYLYIYITARKNIYTCIDYREFCDFCNLIKRHIILHLSLFLSILNRYSDVDTVFNTEMSGPFNVKLDQLTKSEFQDQTWLQVQTWVTQLYRELRPRQPFLRCSPSRSIRLYWANCYAVQNPVGPAGGAGCSMRFNKFHYCVPSSFQPFIL